MTPNPGEGMEEPELSYFASGSIAVPPLGTLYHDYSSSHVRMREFDHKEG